MPILPWKTTRASRISRIVADLQSPKRGGSLVVETGFPTSIVDLFVKHRERLRNHSARRKLKKNRSKNEFHKSTAQLSFPAPQSHPPGLDSTGAVGGDLEIEDLKLSDEARVVDDGCDLDLNRTGVVGGGAAAGGNGVGLVVLKMFVVSILALSTKKFVVEITVSAFLLLLLEFVGKRAIRLNLCVRSSIHKISKRIWIGKDDLIQESMNYERQSVPNVSADDFLNESIDSLELSSSIEEIKLVEPMPKRIEDEQQHLGFLGDEMENKTREKRNRRMFERIVRRKSGNQAIKDNNKEDLELRSDRFDEASIEEHVNEELDDETLDQEQDRQTRNILREEDQHSVAESCEIQWIQRERSMSCPILVAIVLSGLVGGRFLAVVLTTACCFMIKLKQMQGGFRIRH